MASNFSKARKFFFWAFWLSLALFLLDQESSRKLALALFAFGFWGVFLMGELFWERIGGNDPSRYFEGALRFVCARLLLPAPKNIFSLVKQDIPKDAATLAEIFSALAQKNETFKSLLTKANLFPQDAEHVARWFSSIKKDLNESKQFWSVKNLRKRGTLAKHWTAGYTATLDQFSVDLTSLARQSGFPRIAGHKKEIQALERILAKDQINNALLVGEPGSGRKSIIIELASRFALGESMPELNYRRILQLDIGSVLARLPEQSTREAVLDQMFQEVIQAGNVILFIEDLHNFVRQQVREEPGLINITGLFTPYLKSPDFPILASTSFAALHEDMEDNPSLLSLFEKVEVEEINEQETLEVLEELVFPLEKKYHLFISYPALRAIAGLSQKYIQAVPFPKKAIDLLDEAVTYAAQLKERVLLPSHIATLIEQKTQIPVGELQTGEKETLLNLETLIHQRIIDQEEAVEEIASALRRARTEITQRKGPIGGFLFLGPTGVGKTETAKALAAIYFGSEERMIRLDMSEFQNVQDMKRLLGEPGNETGLLTTPIRENPFSLLLLDELEKAHPNVLNLFLQILDEGHVTDGLGRRVSFRHTLIIATSNAGYQFILQAIKQGSDFALLKEKMRDYLFQNNIFRPEFLNRFDGVMIFKPLTKAHLVAIAELMLKKLQKNLREKGIELVITDSLKEKLAELGYDPLFGARPMRRAIQDKVEDPLAVALLRGDIGRGDKAEVDPVSFSVKKL